MRFAQIRSMDISDGEGIGVAIYTQGCNQHCPQCHNPETWDLNAGEEYTGEHQKIILELMNKSYINHLAILGGEPLLPRNLISLITLCQESKRLYPNKKIWCWTGYKWNDILTSKLLDYKSDEDYQNLKLLLFDYIDVLITEPFEIDKKDITLKWRGSANQMVIDLKATLHQDNPLNKPILYCE